MAYNRFVCRPVVVNPQAGARHEKSHCSIVAYFAIEMPHIVHIATFKLFIRHNFRKFLTKKNPNKASTKSVCKRQEQRDNTNYRAPHLNCLFKRQSNAFQEQSILHFGGHTFYNRKSKTDKFLVRYLQSSPMFQFMISLEKAVSS